MSELALVTGGETGIGAAISNALRGEGFEVRTASRRSGCDLTDAASIERLAEGLSRLDLLVNNAGIAEAAPLLKTDDAMWERHFALNVTAAFRLSRAVIPLLMQSKRGRIINVASTAALSGSPYIAAYAASKHALLGLSRVMAAELKGVSVHTVCPGFVDTPLTDRSVQNIVAATGRNEADARAELAKQNPSGRLISPEEIARAVLLLANDDGTGRELVLD
jgi:NAD(P)-dependent dehydrogenase (short-subunit alcohol dehydrogenase family)